MAVNAVLTHDWGMYKKLAIVISINAVLMFFIMFVNLWSGSHFHVNVNRVYMALLMVAPMLLMMVVVMRSMYENRSANIAIEVGCVVAIVALVLAIRTQAGVGDRQFLRSMIPHHSSAILMCEEAAITDEQIRTLCGEIVKTQKEEIAEMERILERLDRR